MEWRKNCENFLVEAYLHLYVVATGIPVNDVSQETNQILDGN